MENGLILSGGEIVAKVDKQHKSGECWYFYRTTEDIHNGTVGLNMQKGKITHAKKWKSKAKNLDLQGLLPGANVVNSKYPRDFLIELPFFG